MTPELEDRIRLRALEIWREEGYPEGRAREHWGNRQSANSEVSGAESQVCDQPTDQAAPEEGPELEEPLSPVPLRRAPWVDQLL